mmetsp:Transcript_110286/g.307299  ORF Transcript_110286/g.307299 Transcript_110286/m.307299 type:complete len:201 (-) Transcript_110286:104-706(-)
MCRVLCPSISSSSSIPARACVPRLEFLCERRASQSSLPSGLAKLPRLVAQRTDCQEACQEAGNGSAAEFLHPAGSAKAPARPPTRMWSRSGALLGEAVPSLASLSATAPSGSEAASGALRDPAEWHPITESVISRFRVSSRCSRSRRNSRRMVSVVSPAKRSSSSLRPSTETSWCGASPPRCDPIPKARISAGARVAAHR